jgi:cell division protein FtsZ
VAALKDRVDALITIPNDRLLSIADQKMSMTDAFALADEVLHQGIEGISDTITKPGMINLDFADVKAIMSHAGSALMAIGRAAGENRAVEAAQAAIASPLLEASIAGAKGVLFNIAGSDFTLYEVDQAAKVIQAEADQDANIIFGAVLDDRLQDEIQITVIATGFEGRATGVSRGILRPSLDAQRARPQPTFDQQRTTEQRLEPQPEPRMEPSRPRPRTEPSYTPRDADEGDDDFDIPAFIRRR